MRRWALGIAVLLLAHPAAASGPLVTSVGTIGITVSDLDRAVAFYRDVLEFSVVDHTEASGSAVEQLEGVFGAHVRNARMRLGNEAIVLTQYLAPRGRPVPADMRSNDRAFQHIAIVVSDMDRAYRHLREHGVRPLPVRTVVVRDQREADRHRVDTRRAQPGNEDQVAERL